jgi:hypothetical protein
VSKAEPLAISLAAAGAAILADGYLADKISSNRAAQIGADLAIAALVGVVVHFAFRRGSAPQGA